MRREKRYAAESGYVFHYYYCGQRPAGGETEYIFEVSPDRRPFVQVAVVLDEEAFNRWQSAHTRSLTPTEQYAIAKMSLLRAFDRSTASGAVGPRIGVSSDEVIEILDTLGID